ncbi:MAG: DUF4186 family protein [Methylomonas sp.]|nr:DUF4186 family protein [Methylomonas sp.]
MPADIPNDGKQTPFKGHPVFVAQHATACCCRRCLQKWHGISAGRQLTVDEQNHIIEVLRLWLVGEVERAACLKADSGPEQMSLPGF